MQVLELEFSIHGVCAFSNTGAVPFNIFQAGMMPKWFRGTACRHVCKSNLHCAEEALGSACALLGDDEALLGQIWGLGRLQLEQIY